MGPISQADKARFKERIRDRVEASRGKDPEIWVDANGATVYIAGTNNRKDGRLTKAEVVALSCYVPGFVVNGVSYRLPVRRFAPTPKPAPFYVVVQQGGSTGEYYVHDFETLKQANAYRRKAAKASYETSAPLKVPGDTNMDALTEIACVIGDMM